MHKIKIIGFIFVSIIGLSLFHHGRGAAITEEIVDGFYRAWQFARENLDNCIQTIKGQGRFPVVNSQVMPCAGSETYKCYAEAAQIERTSWKLFKSAENQLGKQAVKTN